MTKETKLQLRERVEIRLVELTKEVDSLNLTHKKFEVIEKISEDKNLNIDIKGLKDLMNYRLFLSILTLDLCTNILTYLNAKFQYEGIYSARQIIVIISEGYKKIFNFVKENGKGGFIQKYRNNSFWIKEVGQIINELPEFKTQYDFITIKLDDYLKVNFELLKIQRDLSIHYDKEPLKVYNMLSNLDIEDTFKKMIPFLNILNDMFFFTTSLSQAYLQKSTDEKQLINMKLNKLETFLLKQKTSKNVNVEFQNKISKLRKEFNKRQ